MSNDHVHPTFRDVLNTASGQAKSAAPSEQNEMLNKILAGFTPDPGTSDLDDEQPIHVHITLGDYRRIQRIMWKAKGRQ